MSARINIPKAKPTPPRVLTRAIAGHIHGTPSARLKTVWTYRADDACAIQVDFLRPDGEPMTWFFDRSLLFDGLSALAGEGDIEVFPSNDDEHVVLRLQPPDETPAEAAFPIEDVRQFRNITYAIVAAGTEPEQIVPFLENMLHAAAETLGGEW